MATNNREFGRNVFVLDVSGSMAGMKCQTLQLSVTRIIEDIPLKSYVGVILFDSNVEVAQPLTQINSASDRDRVIRNVPAIARGCTDIAKGILAGVRAFTNASVSTEGATIFLVTDGQDGNHYVDLTLPTLIALKIKVVCIAIGNSADPNLERLSSETGGKTYFASDTNRELAARVIEATIQETRVQEVVNGTELAEVINISVSDDIIHITESVLTKNVIFDTDIGRNTVITIGSEDFDKISVVVQSPSGHKYESGSPEFIRSDTLKRFQIRPKITEPGVWTITLKRVSSHPISANLSVKSQPLNPNAVQLSVTLKEADSMSPPIIIAELRKGNNVVIGAEVSAIVDKPNGTQSQLKLKNLNNIYCNYFTDYSGSGRYNVTLLAHNLHNKCQLKTNGSPVPQFERQMIAGCFKITNSLPQRPTDDSKLEELSLSTQFNSMSFDSNEDSVDPPIPAKRREKVVPKPRALPKNYEINKTKESIYTTILVLKKSINSTKITEKEREDLKALLKEIDTQLSSSERTLTDLNNYLEQLKVFVTKLN